MLSRVFRGKFVAALKRNFRQGKLGFHGNLKPLAHPKVFSAWIRTLFRNDWHVYSKRPFGGAEHALCYLGHYTHRVAISNHRLVSFANDQVTFRWRDSAHNSEPKLMTLALDEFLRRFLLHLLPKGFVRIRHFGFLANRRRATLLPLCFRLLDAVPASRNPNQEASATKELEPALALSPMWRPHGGHRETYRGPAPTPFSTASHRSRCMKLPFRSRSLGAFHHLQAWCALVAPPPSSWLQTFATQTTIEPVRSALRLAPSPIPQVFLITDNTIEFA